MKCLNLKSSRNSIKIEKGKGFINNMLSTNGTKFFAPQWAQVGNGVIKGDGKAKNRDYQFLFFIAFDEMGTPHKVTLSQLEQNLIHALPKDNKYPSYSDYLKDAIHTVKSEFVLKSNEDDKVHSDKELLFAQIVNPIKLTTSEKDKFIGYKSIYSDKESDCEVDTKPIEGFMYDVEAVSDSAELLALDGWIEAYKTSLEVEDSIDSDDTEPEEV